MKGENIVQYSRKIGAGADERKEASRRLPGRDNAGFSRERGLVWPFWQRIRVSELNFNADR